MIIGLVGKAGSGKDTVAKMIPGARVFSFADPLKEFCADVFGWSREQLWGSSQLRDVPDPRFLRPDGSPLTPRYALQTLGTEWGRNCCPDVWARLGVKRAQEALEAAPYSANWADDFKIAVFSDCRFVNEARTIREAGGQVWRIVRPGAGLAGAAGVHSSELDQDSPEMAALVTHELINSCDLEQLRAQVSALGLR